MATYDEIYGKRVEVLDADPTLTSAYEGQVWYNSTTGALKSLVSFGAWSSASPLSTARSGLAGGGIQTAAWGVGGVTSFPATTSNVAWSESGTPVRVKRST